MASKVRFKASAHSGSYAKPYIKLNGKSVHTGSKCGGHSITALGDGFVKIPNLATNAIVMESHPPVIHTFSGNLKLEVFGRSGGNPSRA